MDAPAAAHPSDEQLRAFALGKLPGDSTALEAHLETCADCRRRATEASGDSFVRRLADGRRKPSVTQSTPSPPGNLTAIPGDLSLAEPADDVPPELANHPDYVVQKELGRGGMGVVYLAQNVRMQRQEVLKVVNPRLLTSPGALGRFNAEVVAAARLHHTNVVVAYNALDIGGLLVFAMQYVPGRNLKEVVDEKGPLPVRTACVYARQVALGLQHAFEKGLAHRDIKPQNLILTVEGERREHVVKILDFGLAKAKAERDLPVDGAASVHSGMTGYGKMLGTPDYMAPEQIRDAASATITADIYGLGGTMYYLLTGKPPFRAEGVMQLLGLHLNAEPEPLNARRPDVPAELAAVVAKMMAKNPADRYQKPSDVVKALDPFVRAPKTTEPPAAQTVPAGAAATPFDLPAPEPKPLPKAPKKRSNGPLLVAAALAVVAGAAFAGTFLWRTPDGTIIVDDVPEGAVVTVDGDALKVTRAGQTATATVAEGGKHRLKVEVGGQTVMSENVDVVLGGRPVRLRYEAAKPAAVPAAPAPLDYADRFVPLFTDSDFTGWELRNSGTIKWTNSNRTIRGANSGYHPSKGGAAFTLRDDYGDFHFRCEVYAGQKNGAHVLFRHNKTTEHGARRGYAVFTPGSESKDTDGGWGVGSLYEDVFQVGMTKVAPAKVDPPGVRAGDWYRLEIVARGDSVRVLVNGTTTVDTTAADPPARKGSIGFGCGMMTSIAVRNAEIYEFPAQRTAPASPADVQRLTSPASPPTAARPPADYDGIAAGAWVDLVRTPDEFAAALAANPGRSAAADPSYFNGTVSMKAGNLLLPVAPASDAVVRARVRKTGAPFQTRNINLRLRAGDAGYVAGCYNGRGQFCLGRTTTVWRDLVTKSVPNINDNEEFEMALAVVGDRARLYVDGKEILSAWLDVALPPGRVSLGLHDPARTETAYFREVQYQSLDAPTAPAAPAPVADGFVPLFNGRDLAGWVTHPSQPGGWSAESGAIVGSGVGLSHLYTAASDYTDVHFRAEVMVNAGGLGGVCLRAGGRPQFPATGPKYLAGYEGEVAAAGGKYATGSLFAGDAVAVRGVTNAVTRPGEWFLFEMIAERDNVTTLVNGVTVARWTDPEFRYKSGGIALQVQGDATAIRFRNVAAKRLTVPAPPAGELLRNGGFDEPTLTGIVPGWTVLSGEWRPARGGPRPKSYAPRQGANYLYAGVSVRAELEQVVDLAPFAEAVDAARQHFQFQGFARVYKQPDLDVCQVTFDFLAADKSTVLFSYDFGALSPVDDWEEIGFTRAAPPKSRWARVRLTARRRGAATLVNDAYFDGFSLKAAPAPAPVPTPAPPADGFVRLFNGKDLTGWKLHPENQSKWEVRNGVLTGFGANGHLFSLRDDYENFHLRAEARINDGGNSGVGFRLPFFGSGRVAGRGYEAGINSSAPEEWRTGSLMHLPEGQFTGKLVPPGQWFTLEVIAVGNTITIKVNGQTTREVVDTALNYRRGHVALQVMNPESMPEFRSVDIKELPPAAPAPTADGFTPLFNGRDLTGWKTDPKQPGRWTVEGGELVGRGADTSHLYSEAGDYGDVHVRAEVQINDGGNSGITVRAPFGAMFPAPNPRYLFGYEAQINDTGKDQAKTGSITGVNYPPIRSSVPHPPAGRWFTLEMIAQGNLITTRLNGIQAAIWDDSAGRYRSGHVALQVHDAGTVVRFRKIEVKRLPPAAPPSPAPTPAPPATAGFVPLFNGRDLTGWVGRPGIWKVKDGAIVGDLPPGQFTHTFLSTRDNYRDFELRFRVRIPGGVGNSGVQIRSDVRSVAEQTVGGPQVEIDAKIGGLYGELSGGWMREVPEATVRRLFKPDEFNAYVVRAVGRRVTITLNGTVIVNEEFPTAPPSGVIALQLHGRMKTNGITFRDIEIKTLDGATPAAPSGPLGGGFGRPADAAKFGAKWFKVIDARLTWHEAKRRCEQMGGRLAVVESAAENDFVAALGAKAKVSALWLGATDEAAEGTWKWVDGRAVRYAKWDGRPNNALGVEHYVAMIVDLSGQWWDYPDDPTRFPQLTKPGRPAFVCQWSE